MSASSANSADSFESADDGTGNAPDEQQHFFDANDAEGSGADGSGADGSSAAAAAPSSAPPATKPTPSQAQADAADKRRKIQAIMSNKSLTDLERRLQIQQLMDGSKPAVCPPAPPARSSLLSSLSSTLLSGVGGISDGVSGAAVGIGGASTTNAGAKDDGEEVMACVHYERKCNVVAPCCGKVFGCRVCHDEMFEDGCGPMDRFGIKVVVCKECGERQDSK